MKWQSVLLLLTAVVAVNCASYSGQSLVRLEYDTKERSWINQLLKLSKADVWQDRHGVMDLMLEGAKLEKLMEMFQKRGIKGSVLIEDVQGLIDQQQAEMSQHRTSDKAVDSSSYRDLDTLMAELDQLEADFPSLISSYSAGTSYEGRSIRVQKVSTDGADTKEVVWIDCGIHAREWVSQASCMYFLDRLTSGYGSDEEVTALLDSYDFHIMPVTNPDGYVHTWESERLWRKNRQPFDLCYGVDCNRNFDSNFGGPGASDIPCADTYHGPSAFSEAESSAIRDASSNLGSRMKGFFTIHSYSQLWMTPYGYDSTLPQDFEEMMRVAEIGVNALTAVHGTQYQYGNIADIIYVASGGSTDWVYNELGVVYAYALELRDTGTFGFLLPAGQIEATAEETFAGISAAVSAFQ